MAHQSVHETHTESLVDAISVLFPELCGAPVDLERQAPSIVQRALNDGTPELVERVIAHFGEARTAELARARANQLTNPAFRRFQVRFHLSAREPGVTHFQGLWRP